MIPATPSNQAPNWAMLLILLSRDSSYCLPCPDIGIGIGIGIGIAMAIGIFIAVSIFINAARDALNVGPIAVGFFTVEVPIQAVAHG